eukprot:GHRQ01023932.1.p2 GENE.GHRQ01023932.1~~GHRQ01023932.1.p2  ORF type:complete len:104 (+),score=21.43 GHRQ01023932.1:215-526(+)
MRWAQKEVKMPAMKRGCHLVTHLIEREISSDLAQFRVGLAHIFIQHTSASLTINEVRDSSSSSSSSCRQLPFGSSAALLPRTGVACCWRLQAWGSQTAAQDNR